MKVQGHQALPARSGRGGRSFRAGGKKAPQGRGVGIQSPSHLGGYQDFHLGCRLRSPCLVILSAAGGVGNYFAEEVQRLSVSVKSCVRGWAGGVWLWQPNKDEKISPELGDLALASGNQVICIWSGVSPAPSSPSASGLYYPQPAEAALGGVNPSGFQQVLPGQQEAQEKQ